MSLKAYVWLGLSIGSVIGGVFGAWLDTGNPFGLYGIVLGSIGGLAGIWLGFRLYNS